MLEESAMDKKSSVRPGQAPAKGNCSESKKSQDATAAGKQFPRGARKREPPNFNGTKYDQNRKPVPQKSKALDKRPMLRGLYYGGGKEGIKETDKEFDAEFGPLLKTGCKKQSLNHLLNFYHEPRGERMPERKVPSGDGCSTKSLMATQAHKYNKEQFLQANCQFVVREDGDYSFNLGDPDLLVDWDHVELIITSSCEKVVCPICLYPPVAGKITRCGHIFCWSCVLHYLALSDKTWRKCPICYESIHKKDLKSVSCLERASYSVGQTIKMRLMKREKGTLSATPVSQFSARTLKPILSYGEKELDTVYSKLLTASKQNVMDIICREYSELMLQVEEFKGCPELCFVEQALALLAERKSLVESSITNDNAQMADTACSTSNVQNPSNFSNSLNASSPEDKISPFDFNKTDETLKTTNRCKNDSVGSEIDDIPNISADDLEITATTKAQKYFFFYQAADGQQIYIHSINVRMLEMTYESLENCPSEISGKIIEKETGSMTPQLRKRLRYLQHVPITCQFEVIELELLPPTISEETVITFKDQVEERRKRRQRQARAEKIRENKIKEAEMSQFIRRPDPNLKIESLIHFPECGIGHNPRPTSSDFSENIVSCPTDQSERLVNSARSKSPLSSAIAALSIEKEDNSTRPSFAQIAEKEFTAGGKKQTNGDSWATKAKRSSNVGWERRQRQVSVGQESGDSDNDLAFSPPAKPSFNIAEAIQLAASLERGEGTSDRKKKKKHQKILFTTGMPRMN